MSYDQLPQFQWWQRFMAGLEKLPRPFTEQTEIRQRAFVERLTFTVPLHIMELRAQGGIQECHIAVMSHFANVIGEKGDVLLYERGPEREEIFRMLAEGLAILAFFPGGVTFCGQHFEA